MKYLIVDDEKIILEGMAWTLKDVVGGSEAIYTAQTVDKAIEIARNESIDIMFTDIDMPGMNGLKLAETIREFSPDTDVVFATGYAHYSLDAWRTDAQAFILKPVSEEELRHTLDKVLSRRNKKKPDTKSDVADKAEAMCFGNFEISYKGKPVHFVRKKSKEMLAYLIDRRGAMISTDEIRMILWEEDTDTQEKKGYVRVLANDIRKSFENLGIENLLINGQDCYSVDTSKISCDYLDFLNGNKDRGRLFQGEYMTQYSWAETTLARLLNM